MKKRPVPEKSTMGPDVDIMGLHMKSKKTTNKSSMGRATHTIGIIFEEQGKAEDNLKDT